MSASRRSFPTRGSGPVVPYRDDEVLLSWTMIDRPPSFRCWKFSTTSLGRCPLVQARHAADVLVLLASAFAIERCVFENMSTICRI